MSALAAWLAECLLQRAADCGRTGTEARPSRKELGLAACPLSEPHCPPEGVMEVNSSLRMIVPPPGDRDAQSAGSGVAASRVTGLQRIFQHPEPFCGMRQMLTP